METDEFDRNGGSSAHNHPRVLEGSASDASMSHLHDSKISDSLANSSDTGGLRHVHVAHVRFEDGDDHLRLQLHICNDRKTFFRAASEKLDKLRLRLQILASQAAEGATLPFEGNKTRKQRNKTDQRHNQCAKIAVRFLTVDDQEIVGKSVSVADALMRTESIVVGDQQYVVLHNQPTVAKVSVMEPVIAGVPVVPLAETDFCEPAHCQWRWFRVDAAGKTTLVSDERRYVPTEQDVGCHFQIECHAPSMHSCFAHESAAEVVTTPVVYGPDRSVFDCRRKLGETRAKGDDAFRVMTYNVLFDGYTTTMQAKTEIFPYVKHEAMHEMYRMQLVFQEIEESNADVVCMQEMGGNTFYGFFEPMMKPLGFHAFYSGKTGTTNEGCAVLIRSDRFDVVEERMVAVSEAVLHSEDAAIVDLLAAFPEFEKGLQKIPSVAQILILGDRRNPLKRILLVNTHLFYREDADMIRLLQAAAVVREIERVKQSLEADDTAQTGVLFCGDFNAVPESATVSFLLGGTVGRSHCHWQEAADFTWKRASTRSMTVAANATLTANAPSGISHSLSLKSVCGMPEFTNFAGSFVATLDYILISERELEVAQVFPPFTREEVSREVALPSTTFPSDHISLIGDIRWR